MGEVSVPKDAYWGAQTQRSLQNFPIGHQKMPLEIIYAYAYLKRSTARVNHTLGELETSKADAIIQACDEIVEGKLDEHFPLVVWQTGSGTQTNMNLNEVIANRATELLGYDFRTHKLIHPNDDVNRAQSSNDTFPTAMRIAFVRKLYSDLLPALQGLQAGLRAKEEAFSKIIKIGRTHLQDATPLTLGQEFSAYVAMMQKGLDQINDTLKYLLELAIGGSAVGTGLNTPLNFSSMVCEELNRLLDLPYPFVSHPNKFHALTSHDAEVMLSGVLNAMAANLMKMANDIRWLASGPRCGIGELTLQPNEPGSSIMPAKVNPTQSEALTMVAVQVMGNHTAITIAASQGNFELNVFKPLIAHNLLESITLLSDAMQSFNQRCIAGIQANEPKITQYLNDSLMLVTALSPHIGYEKAAKIAKAAHQNGTTLKVEAVKLGYLSAEEFDHYCDVRKMV